MPTQRPDSEDHHCDVYVPGRPGDGVMVMNMRGWQPPRFHSVDEAGRIKREFNGHGHVTTRADVPALRGLAVIAPCSGDGHYACKGCIFYRLADRP